MRISDAEARQRGWTTDKAKRMKYGNRRTQTGFGWFDSAKEAMRRVELDWLERAGEITRIQCQPPFDLHGPNGQKIGRFRPDFRYVLVRNGEVIVEDVKSPITRKETAYRLRKKLVEAEYGITVVEI